MATKRHKNITGHNTWWGTVTVLAALLKLMLAGRRGIEKVSRVQRANMISKYLWLALLLTMRRIYLWHPDNIADSSLLLAEVYPLPRTRPF